jgi:hypothetical protein
MQEEDVMQGKQRRQQWALIWLVLMLAVPALAQIARVGETEQPQPGARLQVTQTLTIAVCGDECDCGAATLVAKEHGPCEVQSSTGRCSIGSGACCVCAAANTIAVCGDECDCGAALLVTKVPAPCRVTSSAGQCDIGSGECCVCASN